MKYNRIKPASDDSRSVQGFIHQGVSTVQMKKLDVAVEIERLRDAIRSAAMHIFKARERFLTHDYIDRDHGWIVEDHLNAAREALEQSVSDTGGDDAQEET